MKKRPTSANRSRSTPSTTRATRPSSAQISSTTSRKREISPTRSIRFTDETSSSPATQRHNTFVTTSKNINDSNTLPNLENINTSNNNKRNTEGGEEQHVPQTENRSSLLLRGLVSAETGFNRTSILEQLICAYLRMKSDVKVLRDFSSFCLTTPQDVDTNTTKLSAQEIFSSHVSDSTRIIHILKLNDLRDKLLFDLCSGLLIETEMGMKDELEPLPDTCSPRLISLLQLFGTFLEMAKDLTSKRSKLDPVEERNAQLLQEKYKNLEQAYTTLRADSKALKAKYDGIMTDGGKHQGMARQQHTIDELELKVKSMTKFIDDADNAKKTALKSELKMKDDVLQLQTQLDALRATYEGELGNLKPLVHEQVSHTSVNMKEIRDLKTNILLQKERYSLLTSQFAAAEKEFQRTKALNSELERKLGFMTEKADNLENNGTRLEKLLKVTAAAKLSGDENITSLETKNKKLENELTTTKDNLQDVQKEAAKLTEKLLSSERKLLECKRQDEQLKTKYQAKCCEIISLEGALDEQAAQVSVLMKRMNEGGGSVGDGMGAINLSMKNTKKSDRSNIIRSSSSVVPRIGLALDDDDMDDVSETGKRSKILTKLADEMNDRHQLELNKRDHKIRKYDERLKKSQALLKDALDRVWQLEKVKLDEAAGAIPQRKGGKSSPSPRQDLDLS